jgi:hypothetical protein
MVANNNIFYGFTSAQPFAMNSSCNGFQNWTTYHTTNGYETNSLYSDPLLYAKQYLLTGSPAIAAGENLAALSITALNSDRDGNARPGVGGAAWDMGAYIYNGSMTTTTTTATTSTTTTTTTTTTLGAAPVLSAQTATAQGKTSVLVTWTTDVAASGRLDLGYGTGYDLGRYTETGYATSHSILITGLNSGYTYHYQIRSTGQASGATTIDSDRTFSIPGTSAARIRK